MARHRSPRGRHAHQSLAPAVRRPVQAEGARRSVPTPLRRGAAVVAVTGGAFSLVGAASPALAPAADVAPEATTAAFQAVAQSQAVAQAPTVVVRTAVEVVAPEPEVVDATDLVKAVQMAEEAQRVAEARVAQERAAAEAAAAKAAEERALSARPASTASTPASGGDCGVSTAGLGAVKSHVRTAAEFLGCLFGEPRMIGVASRSSGTSDHPSGLAIDFMVDRSTGDRLAECALRNKDALGISYVIWEQRINHGTGWKAMEDRGSATANHFDHVHVSFDPSRGSGATVSC